MLKLLDLVLQQDGYADITMETGRDWDGRVEKTRPIAKEFFL